MYRCELNAESLQKSPIESFLPNCRPKTQMATYKQDLYKYGVFILSITGMIVNLGAIVHLVKQEWVELWFPLSSTVPFLPS